MLCPASIVRRIKWRNAHGDWTYGHSRKGALMDPAIGTEHRVQQRGRKETHMQKERKDKWPEKREHIILDSWQEIKTLDLQSYATPDADTLISKPCPVFYQGFYWINHWWLATIDWAVKMQPVRMRDAQELKVLSFISHIHIHEK